MGVVVGETGIVVKPMLVVGITLKLGEFDVTVVMLLVNTMGGGMLVNVVGITTVVSKGMVDVVVVVYESPKVTIVEVDVEKVVLVAVALTVVVPGSSMVGALPLHRLSSSGLETHFTQE
jgi:hypothetical protein